MPVRWSSTHEMIADALKLQGPIIAYCASQQLNPSMRSIQLTQDDWSTLSNLAHLFAIFVKPTMKMQGSTYPTLSAVVPWYLNMIVKLKKVMRTPGVSAIIVNACTATLRKLDKYHTFATNQVPSHSNVTTILDPRMNLRGFDNVMPDSSDP